jgi:hypothetical protein
MIKNKKVRYTLTVVQPSKCGVKLSFYRKRANRRHSATRLAEVESPGSINIIQQALWPKQPKPDFSKAKERNAMQAYVVEHPEGLFTRVDLPRPQALVRVHASGVNPLDTKIRAGKAPTPGSHCLRCWAFYSG